MANNTDYQDFLRELKLRVSLVDTVARYVPITKKGGRYFCVCPFHADKNPSMAINEQDGFYHCFACQATGDVIKFIMDIESIDFNEAIKILAEKANIPVPEFKKDPEKEKKKEHSDILKNIMLDAAKFYRNNLLDEVKGKEAREYLEARGFSKDTIMRYGFGVSLDYESLPKYLVYKHYLPKDIKECGLIANESNMSDMFANRIIVPIIDSMSNVIAFGGRVYHGEDKTKDVAKYKNSTNTPLFNKSYFVYGINFIKKDRKTTGPIQDLILVEGYMDVISLGSAGITNVVAGMGTALTEGQAREIKKIVDKIYVCYDGDNAGRKATIRNIDILDSVGFDVKVMSLDKDEDPDETIKNHGVEYFLKKKEEALPIVDYKLKICENAYNIKTPDGKSKYVQSAIKVLKSIKDESKLEIYLKVVSELTNISIDRLRKSVISGVYNPDEKISIAPENVNENNKRSARFVLSRIMNNSKYVEIDLVKIDWFKDQTHKKIIEYAKSLKEGETFNVGLMFSEIETNAEIEAILDINFTFGNQNAEKDYYLGCLSTIANDFIQKGLDELSKKMEKEEDKEKKRVYRLEYQELQKKKHASEIKAKI